MLLILLSCQFAGENCKIFPLDFQHDLSNIYNFFFFLDISVNTVKQTGFSVILFNFIAFIFFDYKQML